MSETTGNTGKLKAIAIEDVARAVEDAIDRLDKREREEKAAEREKAASKDRLTNRVSIAAICLTMLMSFLNFARSERDGAATAASAAAAKAKRDAEANWAYYQTRISERSAYAIADDSLQREASPLANSDARLQLAAAHHAEYVARMAGIDGTNRQVFFLIQDFQREQILRLREASHIGKQIARYDMGIRVLTLAVVLLSVTLLANREYLFWIAVLIAMLGATIAVDGYFLVT